MHCQPELHCGMRVGRRLQHEWLGLQTGGEASIKYTALHVGRRWFEVACHLATLLLLGDVLGTMEWVSKPVKTPFCRMCYPVALLWIMNSSILCWARPADAPRESCVAIAGVGFVALAVVPSTFVDVPGYFSTASRVTWRLWIAEPGLCHIVCCCLRGALCRWSAYSAAAAFGVLPDPRSKGFAHQLSHIGVCVCCPHHCQLHFLWNSHGPARWGFAPIEDREQPH